MATPREPKTQARSLATRARILATARAQFAREGYERTTIRSVAAAAEIDPALVMRYFGSKEGLFSAAADFDLQLPDLRALPARTRGRALAEHFVKVWTNAPSGFNPMAVLLRAAATNETGAERVIEIFREQVRPTVAAVVADHAEARAALVSAHVFGFAYCRFVVKLPAMASMPVARLVDRLGAAIQRSLEDAI